MDTIVGIFAARPAAGRQARSGAGRPRKPGRALHVLVAEDNGVNQQVAVGMLERAGHEATVAENGREVLALLERSEFDVVLMDVQMPELDGLETTVAIRERERAKGGHLPIVAVTAHAMKGDAERCLAAGMDGYLSKPLQPRELAEAIARVVPSAGAQASAPASETPALPSRGSGPFDDRKLLERVGGDRSALAALVRIFRADWPLQLSRLRRAVADADAPALRAAAHALKGAVSNFAAPAPTETAFTLQKMGEAGRLAGASAVVERLEREVDELVAALAEVVRASRPLSAQRRRAPAGPRRARAGPRTRR
jgi:CheY-like chemotaxis protein/HPt (histidine-containing phosphotransfer) domain-containing protein